LHPADTFAHTSNMASQADFKDRQFLAVIGDEVSNAALAIEGL